MEKEKWATEGWRSGEMEEYRYDQTGMGGQCRIIDMGSWRGMD